MKILSLFSGIGAFEKALDNLGIQYELAGYSEIDKYAVKSYCAIHGVTEDLNLGDITKINEKSLPKDLDLITYGFPCQDISLAGKQKGMFNADGTQTRSGLFFEALRIIEETQPKVAIAENVKNLTSKKFKLQFDIVLRCLEAAGYNNYWKVLNAKDYGIPQSRERVFIVSIRKDVDNGTFEFPEGFPLELRLKDMLEEQVDEKFYISDTQLSNLVKNGNFNCNPSGKGMNGKVYKGELSPTITTNKGEGLKFVEPINTAVCIEAYNLNHYGNDQMNRVYSSEGISPTVLVKSGGGRETKVAVCEAVNTMPDGTCRTLKNQYGKTSKANFERSSTFGATGATDGLRIRKLTPKECFRLMGFDDPDYYRLVGTVSNSQLYKQAGNSIVVDVLEHLLPNVLKAVE